MQVDGLMGRLQLVGPAVDLAVEEINSKYAGVFSIRRTFLYDVNSASCGDLLASEVDLIASSYYRAFERKSKLTALIYPGCFDQSAQILWLTKEWNFLTIVGSVQALTKSFPQAVVTAYANSTPYGRLIVALLMKYKWTDVYIVYDSSPSRTQFRMLALGAVDAVKTIKGFKFNIAVRPVDCVHNATFTEALKDFRRQSRVLIFFGNNDFVRTLLIEASTLNMTDGEYVYITINSGPDADRGIYGRLEWQKQDENDEVARNAFRSLLVASPLPDTINPENIRNFSARIRQISMQNYNYTYTADEEPNYVVKSMYISYWMLAQVISDVLSTDDPIDLSNGAALSEQFHDRTFDMSIGKAYIDDKGQRTDAVAIFHFDASTNTFTPVIKQDDVFFILYSVRNFTWPNGKWPPLNTPLCGYSQLEGPCRIQASSTMLSGVVCGSVAVVVLVVLVVIGLRVMHHRARLSNRWWELDRCQFSVLSGRSVSVIAPQFFRNDPIPLEFSPKSGAALYRFHPVFLSRLPAVDCAVTNRHAHMLFDQLSSIQHSNINSMVGILYTASETAFSTWYVDPLCPRLDLETVLADASSNMLDLEFRHGITRDILSGLQCVFTSSVKYCGYLKPTTCLIDSRFSVKLSKIGYDRLLRSLSTSEKKWPFNDLNTVAPEHRSTLSGSPAGDLYSLGTVLEMVYSDSGLKNPLKRKKSVISHIETFLHTISACRDVSPDQRPHLSTLISQQRKTAHFADNSFLESVMRRMEAYAETLESSVAQRTKQLLHEQRKCDELLAEMLPSSIVIILRQGQIVEAEVFDVVSVLFSDIVGFSEMVAHSKPVNVVEFLNSSHGLFDRVLTQFDAYKVETINDCYLVASGVLPIRNGSRHALNVCKVALKFVNSFDEYFPATSMSVKIGVHTGPCVAAVAGTKRPRYCLFGDTINTASRMESHGKAGKIHASQATADYVATLGDAAVTVCPRGAIQIKGKGIMHTYWIVATANYGLTV
ncbi:atrial natriuretic peptide receptor 1-like [Paramacrobiotus metropolitanus]|uniref:atrial natriuretic peptide receptor 1-like n=1 Tax=Paramacrobiotus metropolitanus TaxID=2943436 RepID=UPI002445F088|nr:atrial natriuretic peptide receptor 1-like [Paramacrobiotus metropolitanus]